MYAGIDSVNTGTGLSGADAVELSKNAVWFDNKKKELDAAVAKKTAEQTVVMQSHIYANANMQPMNVVLICICIVILLWLIHMLYKPNASGLWVAVNGKQYIIKHNRWLNTIVCVGSDITLYGSISGNLVIIADETAIWNYGDVILFTNGTSLQRLEY